MIGRVIILLLSIVLLLAHLTGNMGALATLIDIDIEPSRIIYLALLPLVGLFGIYLLSDGR